MHTEVGTCINTIFPALCWPASVLSSCPGNFSFKLTRCMRMAASWKRQFQSSLPIPTMHIPAFSSKPEKQMWTLAFLGVFYVIHVIWFSSSFYLTLLLPTHSLPQLGMIFGVLCRRYCVGNFAGAAAYKLKGGLNLDHLSCAASWVQSVKPCETHTTYHPSYTQHKAFILLLLMPASLHEDADWRAYPAHVWFSVHLNSPTSPNNPQWTV